ncbi:hypothetical protein E3N88_11014 [Mikania micrantha]|uniref:Trichome birefringence-like C-terminal domain-containing protein n=1 Tax=Mikania micrantha TaxID=192012 RepID=A0A5N6PCJ2_9ASTR|nr:hypothetical protein E3N88_11014 [Mikania micrantha]
MAESTKYMPVNGGTVVSEFKFTKIFSFRTKRTRAFAYVFIAVFVAFTVFLAFNPSQNPSSPWFSNIFTGSSFRITSVQANGTVSSSSDSGGSVRSQFSSIYSYFFTSNSSQSAPNSTVSSSDSNITVSRSRSANNKAPTVNNEQPIARNQTPSHDVRDKVETLKTNHTTIVSPPFQSASNQTKLTPETVKKVTGNGDKSSSDTSKLMPENGNKSRNSTSSVNKEGNNQGVDDLDYNCTVEFFVAPFIVREYETKDKNGTTKETLRLDLIGTSADQYKTADFVVFNTGHWWTHEKTAKGKDYYQEGSHVYNELNVLEAFRKAMTTWGRWVDANINPRKTLVFFRGYSASHFRGGQWNSGGQCDNEVEPIKNTTYLSPYPDKMKVLERVLRGMKTKVSYLNITRLTDFRKDGHPSIYRKQHYTEEERRSPLHFQDCSHWCLPGVPDSWNEILYAELLAKQYQSKHQKN